MPYLEISNDNHQSFLGALSKKKKDDFLGIINQVLRIFWFQALWKPHFENKRNFWINCVCTKAFCVMIYLQGGICIHCIPTRGRSRHGILPNGHSYHDILPKRHLHSLHTQAGIGIHYIPKRAFTFIAYLQGYICITAYLQGYISIMTSLQGASAS